MPERRGGSPDHDLLLTFKAEVSTKLDRAIADIADLKNSTTKRVDALENEKADKTTTNDHERRLRFIERYVWGAIGIVGLLNLIGIGLIISHFHT